MKNRKSIIAILFIVVLLALFLVACSNESQNDPRPPSITNTSPATPTVSSGRLEGGYYAHHEDGRSARAFTFSGNTFTQEISYASFVGIDIDWLEAVGDYISQSTRDSLGNFFDLYATFGGTFTLNESTRRISLHYDRAIIRQALHDMYTHPFMLALGEEHPNNYSSSMVEQLDEMVEWIMDYSMGFSFEDGFDILYPISTNWNDHETIQFFDPLIREGLSLDILDTVGGDERLGQAALIGTWLPQHTSAVTFRFYADGTVGLIASNWTDNGTWVLDGNRLTIDFGEDDWNDWQGEWMVRIMGDIMTMGRSDGGSFTLDRVS